MLWVLLWTRLFIWRCARASLLLWVLLWTRLMGLIRAPLLLGALLVYTSLVVVHQVAEVKHVINLVYLYFRFRIQEQLRRIKRNEGKDHVHSFPPYSSSSSRRGGEGGGARCAHPSPLAPLPPMKKLKREHTLLPLKLLKLQKASKVRRQFLR